MFALIRGCAYTHTHTHTHTHTTPQEAHLFLVCMSHSHPRIVNLRCDGCESKISAQWYRDMDYDEDLDLCPKCFEGKLDLASLVTMTVLSW